MAGTFRRSLQDINKKSQFNFIDDISQCQDIIERLQINIAQLLLHLELYLKLWTGTMLTLICTRRSTAKTIPVSCNDIPLYNTTVLFNCQIKNMTQFPQQNNS